MIKKFIFLDWIIHTAPSSPCDTNPCKNGGTCNANGQSYTCQCSTGYDGENCENGKLTFIVWSVLWFMGINVSSKRAINITVCMCQLNLTNSICNNNPYTCIHY